MFSRDSGDAVPPAGGLVTFDGREFSEAVEWDDAFDAWQEARTLWLAGHPGADLAERVLSTCPWEDDDGLPPHSGLSSRSVGEDVVRCAEHGLPPDQH